MAAVITTTIEPTLLASDQITLTNSGLTGSAHSNDEIRLTSTDVVGDATAVNRIRVNGGSTVTGIIDDSASSMFIPTFDDIVDTLDAEGISYIYVDGDLTLQTGMDGI